MLGREAEETLAPKMSLTVGGRQWGPADSLGFHTGKRVIQEQGHHEHSDSFCFREREVTLVLSQAEEEDSSYSAKHVVRQSFQTASFVFDLMAVWKSWKLGMEGKGRVTLGRKVGGCRRIYIPTSQIWV